MTLWRPHLPRHAAHLRDRHPHRIGCATGTGASADLERWFAPGIGRPGAWTLYQRRSHTQNPVAALRNPSTRSGGLRAGCCRTAAGRSDRLHGSCMAGFTARSDQSTTDGVIPEMHPSHALLPARLTGTVCKNAGCLSEILYPLSGSFGDELASSHLRRPRMLPVANAMQESPAP